MIEKKIQNTLTLAKVNLGTLEKKEVFCRDPKKCRRKIFWHPDDGIITQR